MPPSRQILGTVIATCTRLGAKLPQAVTTDLDKLTATEERARKFRADGRGHNLGHAVVAAFEADNDPLTDPGVLQAVVRRTLNDLQPGTDAALVERAQASIEDHVLVIVDALRKPFTTAAAGIAASLDTLGSIDLDDTHAVVSRGGEAAKAWGEAQSALGVIADITTAWKSLAQTTPQIPWVPRHASLLIADIPVDEYVDLPEAGTLGAWDIARLGWTLDLATPDTLRQRTAAVNQERTRRAEAGKTAAWTAAQDSYRAIPRSGSVA